MDKPSTMPSLNPKQALEYMNRLDDTGKPIPFTVWAVAKERDSHKSDFGKVIKLQSVIMARNVKFLDGNLAYNDVEIPNVQNDDWIFAPDWKFYNPTTQEIKSLINYNITHIDYMEIL